MTDIKPKTNALVNTKNLNDMSSKYIKILLCTLITLVMVASCYKDKATGPVASFKVYKYDENRNLVEADSIFTEDRILFVNTGEADHYVVWPAEKRMGFSGNFNFTAESFNKMEQSLVPDTIIKALRFLEGKSYNRESLLSRAILEAIGGSLDVFYTYEYQIKSSAIEPPKDRNGNDSIRFSYNHDYLDFINASERGYYNVTGWPLTMDVNRNYSREYIYRLPGKFKVIMVSTGVADFGASLTTDTTSIQLTVYPKKLN
jgi:hypothetical protein